MTTNDPMTTQRPVCVLVGAPGAGKSTVGALVAEALCVPMCDTDTVIEDMAGKTISDIFVEDGEACFRDLERQAVATALATCSGVLALGGGAVLAEENRDRLRDQVVVHLSVELADAISRVGLGQGRPLLTVSPRATMKYLLDQRRSLYQQVATVTVVTDGRTPEDVARDVLLALRPGQSLPTQEARSHVAADGQGSCPAGVAPDHAGGDRDGTGGPPVR